MGWTQCGALGTEWGIDGAHDSKDFVVGWLIVPEDIQVLIPRTCECHLIWWKDFADMIKNLELGRLPLSL